MPSCSKEMLAPPLDSFGLPWACHRGGSNVSASGLYTIEFQLSFVDEEINCVQRCFHVDFMFSHDVFLWCHYRIVSVLNTAPSKGPKITIIQCWFSAFSLHTQRFKQIIFKIMNCIQYTIMIYIICTVWSRLGHAPQFPSEFCSFLVWCRSRVSQLPLPR